MPVFAPGTQHSADGLWPQDAHPLCLSTSTPAASKSQAGGSCIMEQQRMSHCFCLMNLHF